MIRTLVSGSLVVLSLVSIAACGTSSPPVETQDASSAKEERTTSVSQSISIDPKPADQAVALDPVVANTWFPSGAKPFRNGIGNTAAIAFGGDDYFAAWVDERAGYQSVFGARISESGAMREPAGILLSPLPLPHPPLDLFGNVGEKYQIIVASGAAGSVAFWIDRATQNSDPALRGTLVDPDGKVAGRYLVERPAVNFRSSVGSGPIDSSVFAVADSQGFWVLYYVNNPKGGIDLLARRIVPGAEIGAPQTILSSLSLPLNSGSFDLPRLASIGTTALIAWNATIEAEAGTYNGVRYALIPSGTLGATPNAPDGDAWYLYGASATADAFRIVSESDPSRVRVTSISSTGAITANSPLMDLVDYHTVVPDPATDGFLARSVPAPPNACIRTFSTSGVVSPCNQVPTDPARPANSLFGDFSFAAGKTTLLDNVPDPSNGVTQASVSTISRTSLTPIKGEGLSRAANQETFVSLATDGDGYLAVWLDTRSSTAPASFGYPNQAVYAMRLDASGGPQGSPVKISEGEIWVQLGSNDLSGISAPHVVFDGKKYFAAWLEQQPGAVQGVEISRTGAITVDKKISIPTSTAIWGDITVGNDAKNRMIVWAELNGGGNNIVLARVSIDSGALIDTTPQTISNTGQQYRLTPQLAFDGKNTLVAWSELVGFSLAIFGTLIPDGEAAPLAAPFRIFDGSVFAWRPRVASAGANGFFVAWSQVASAEFAYDIFGKIVRSDGTTLGISPAGKVAENDPLATIPIATTIADQGSVDVAYARDDANYVVTWNDNRNGNYDIYASWISVEDGTLRDPNGVAIAALPAFEAAPSIAMRKDGKGLVAYQEFVEGASTNAYRLRIRSVDSGKLKGAACTTNDECSTRSCVEGVCCNVACNGGCGTCSATPGTCTPKAAATGCGRLNAFKCDGTSLACPTSCETNGDCVTSFYCRNRACEPTLAFCADETHLDDGNGNISDCGTYKCLAGQCRNPCVSIEDCTGNLICDFKGACVEPPVVVNEEGCSTSPNNSSSWLSLTLLGFISGAFARRARNKKGGAR